MVTRYKKISSFFKAHFNKRMVQIGLNAGFTCPNIDGTRGIGGCTFCNNEAFSPSSGFSSENILSQIDESIQRYQQNNLKKRELGFLAFFQSYSNTYASIKTLEALWMSALSHKNIEGLIISTRPDCLSKDTIELLEQFSHKTFLSLELGIESIHNETLISVNRGHLFEEVEEVFPRLKAIKNLYLCVHLIYGLPGETRDMMIKSIKKISLLKPHGIKFHQLDIVQGTQMEMEYQQGFITLLSPQEYISLVVESLRWLHPDTIIHRLHGHTHDRFLVAPKYQKRINYSKLIEETLEKENIIQGDWHYKLKE